MGIFASREKTLHDRPGRRSSGLQRTVSVHVDGIRGVLRALEKLPEAYRNRAVRPALLKATTPILKAAKRLAPLGSGKKPGGQPRDHLRKTLAKVGPKAYGKFKTLVVVIGPKAKQAPHSHLVHDGTKPHEIKLSKMLLLDPHSKADRKAAKKTGARLVHTVIPAGSVIHHPGSKANPFLANAINATRAQSFIILKRGLKDGIEKQAARLAAKRAGRGK